MMNTTRLAIALVITGLATPALAGGWPNIPVRKPSQATAPTAVAPAFVGAEEGGRSPFRTEENEKVYLGARATPGDQGPYAKRDFNGFTFVGGDTGWVPTSHTLVWTHGKFAHSDECDHVIRMAQRPTPSEVESAKLGNPGG